MLRTNQNSAKLICTERLNQPSCLPVDFFTSIHLASWNVAHWCAELCRVRQMKREKLAAKFESVPSKNLTGPKCPSQVHVEDVVQVVFLRN